MENQTNKICIEESSAYLTSETKVTEGSATFPEKVETKSCVDLNLAADMMELSVNAIRDSVDELGAKGDLTSIKLEVSLATERFIYLRKTILYLEYITKLNDELKERIHITEFEQELREMEEEANSTKTVALCQRISNFQHIVWLMCDQEMERYSGSCLSMTTNRIKATLSPLRFDCLETHIDYLDLVAEKMNENRLITTHACVVSQLLRELMNDLKSRCASGERTGENTKEITSLESRVICALRNEKYLAEDIYVRSITPDDDSCGAVAPDDILWSSSSDEPDYSSDYSW
jgi:hypothetical protein